MWGENYCEGENLWLILGQQPQIQLTTNTTPNIYKHHSQNKKKILNYSQRNFRKPKFQKYACMQNFKRQKTKNSQKRFQQKLFADLPTFHVFKILHTFCDKQKKTKVENKNSTVLLIDHLNKLLQHPTTCCNNQLIAKRSTK